MIRVNGLALTVRSTSLLQLSILQTSLLRSYSEHIRSNSGFSILPKDTVQQQGIEPPTFQKVDRHPKAVTYYSCYMPGSWKCRIERFPRINVSNKQLCGYSVTLASEGTTTVLCKSLEPLISLFCFEGDTFLLFLCFFKWS